MTRFLLVLLMAAVLASVGCGNNDDSQVADNTDEFVYISISLPWQEELADRLESRVAEDADTFQFALDIQERVCCPYREFAVYWSPLQDETIPVNRVMTALMDADQNGKLMCDCYTKGDKEYAYVVESISLMQGDQTGLKIVFHEQVFLNGEDVIANMTALFADNDNAILSGHQFSIWSAVY